MVDSELFLAFLNICGFSLLLLIAESLHRQFNISEEHSRKFIHIAGGFWALFTPLWIKSVWILVVLSSLVVVLLWYTKRKGLLRSIHGISRPSVGSIVFIIPILACYLVSLLMAEEIYFYLPVIIMIVSDSLAFYVGRKFVWLPFQIGKASRTASGSLVFFASSVLISFLILGADFEVLALSFCIGFITTLVEAISQKGWDNLFVPLSALLVLWLWT